MTREEIFDAWAPRDAIWSPWVRPVLFSQMQPRETPGTADVTMELGWAARQDTARAVVVDLPGVLSIQHGLSLASLGYRPVPLFNASPGAIVSMSLVDVRPMLRVLVDGAPLLTSYLFRPMLPLPFCWTQTATRP